MGEYLPKDWRDQVTVDPDTEALERAEEALHLSAKSGSLFLPDMTPKEWRRFVKAARIEEEERRAGVPRKASRLTEKQRAVLEKASESVRNIGVQKVLKRRDELVKRLRPQCVDADGGEMAEQMLEELGLTEEEFKALDKSLGRISEVEWQELEARNQPDDDEEL
jgi:hypothetical protein